MRKMITGFALAALLIVGFAFADNSAATDLSVEREPSILSIKQPVSFY